MLNGKSITFLILVTMAIRQLLISSQHRMPQSASPPLLLGRFLLLKILEDQETEGLAQCDLLCLNIP